MQLLIIRHGRAEDRAPDGLDASRRLTDDGRARMREIARGLKTQIERIDVIATSPLPRAHETATIVAEVLGTAAPETLDLLAPGVDARALVCWLAQQRTATTVAIVGHEPDLSRIVGQLIADSGPVRIQIKKGSICLIEFDSRPALGAGRLLSLMQPAQLRCMSPS
jgi:phosphohistidine phosphatase